MQLLSGKEVAKTRQSLLKERIEKFRTTFGKPPGLAVILVGDDPASQVYVNHKEKDCVKVGIHSARYDIDKKGSQEELESLIIRLNADRDIHGILVQIPLPQYFSYHGVLSQLNPLKDADGLTYENMGRLWSGHCRVAPCTPAGVMAILEHYDISVAGKSAVVIGRSNIVGKPMAHLLTQANATTTVCHSKTPDLTSYSKNADIVVVAAGKPHLIGKDHIKKDAVVVDVGIHRSESGKLIGDVKADELDGWASALTPVPGGVGPMTRNMLLENTVTLAEELEKSYQR